MFVCANVVDGKLQVFQSESIPEEGAVVRGRVLGAADLETASGVVALTNFDGSGPEIVVLRGNPRAAMEAKGFDYGDDHEAFVLVEGVVERDFA